MRKFGLLGKKLSHSLSPLLHNTFFEDIGIEAEYKLYEVDEAEIDNCTQNVNEDEKIYIEKFLRNLMDISKEVQNK